MTPVEHPSLDTLANSFINRNGGEDSAKLGYLPYPSQLLTIVPLCLIETTCTALRGVGGRERVTKVAARLPAL